MFQKVFLLAFTWYLTAILTGCDRCKCNPVVNTRFRWTTLQLAQHRVDTDATGGYSTHADTETDFSGKSYALQGVLSYELLAYQKHTPAFSLLPSAYACDCVNPVFTAQVQAGPVRVYTVRSFDATHAAGSEVTDYFRTIRKEDYRLLDTVHHDFLDGSRTRLDTAFNLLLVQKPSNTLKHQFRVEIRMSDSTIITALSPEVKLN